MWSCCPCRHKGGALLYRADAVFVLQGKFLGDRPLPDAQPDVVYFEPHTTGSAQNAKQKMIDSHVVAIPESHEIMSALAARRLMVGQAPCPLQQATWPRPGSTAVRLGTLGCTEQMKGRTNEQH